MSNIPPPPGAPPPPPPPGYGSTPPPPGYPAPPPAPPGAAPGYAGAPPPVYGAPPAYGAGPAYATPPANYAGWWQRVGAAVIDGLISLLFSIPGFVVLFAGPSEIEFQADGPSGPGRYEVPTDGTVLLSVGLFVALGLVYLTIYCRMVGRTGQSLGKKATGYRTLGATTHQPVGAWKIFARQILAFLNSAPCLLGYLWPLWDEQKRTFTDMIFETRAVRS